MQDELQEEFVVRTLRRLDEVAATLRDAAAAADDATDVPAERFNDAVRDVLTVKGQAGTFGFPTLTLIAHLLESHLIETDGKPDAASVDIKVGWMRAILLDGADPLPSKSAEILRSLIHGGDDADRSAPARTVLVVAPSAMLEQIVKTAAAGVGWHAVAVRNEFDGLMYACRLDPDAAIVSGQLTSMEAPEFVGALRAIRRLADVPVFVITSTPGRYDEDGPPGTRVLRYAKTIDADLRAALTALPAPDTAPEPAAAPG